MDKDLVDFVIGSRIRYKILVELNNKECTPTYLSKSCALHISSVSRSLKELLKEEMIACINNDKKIPRNYSITYKGISVLKQINQETGFK